MRFWRGTTGPEDARHHWALSSDAWSAPGSEDHQVLRAVNADVERHRAGDRRALAAAPGRRDPDPESRAPHNTISVSEAHRRRQPAAARRGAGRHRRVLFLKGRRPRAYACRRYGCARSENFIVTSVRQRAVPLFLFGSSFFVLFGPDSGSYGSKMGAAATTPR